MRLAFPSGYARWQRGCGCGARFYSFLGSTIGENKNFKILREAEIPELGIRGIKIQHSSGTTLLHLYKGGDKNCAFSIGFRTFPTDCTGVAHILEHTVLCGSEKYPVRDPFFKMLNRSLSTYMNAWTAADWTMYPFTTQNPQDYRNLRDVYLDAVFNPKLNELDFRQEGWRLENSRLGDRKSPLQMKGVVYNEMKGALSDNESLFSIRAQQSMFPNSIYSYVTGGDPLHIPRLSHADLISFHQKHYHPQNSLLVSYGEMDLGAHMTAMDEFLSKMTTGKFTDLRDPMDGFVAWKTPRRIEVTCPPDPIGDPEGQVKMIVSFLCNPIVDSQTSFNMKILSSLLFDGPSSPMYKALIDSNIGSDYVSGSGYDSSTAYSTLSVGLQGIREQDINMVQSLIMETFNKVRKEGFESAQVEAVLHQIELSCLYHTSNFGLGLAQKATCSWVHQVCPLEDLQVREKVESFQKAYTQGGLFESYLDRFVFNNAHQMLFVMKPDPDFALKTEKDESVILDGLKSQFTEQDFEKNLLLEQAQGKKDEGRDQLPCLALADIPRRVKPHPFKVDPSGTFVRHSKKANGLGYFRAKLMLSDLSEDEVSLLPLLTSCLTELGVTTRPMDEFDQAIKMYTGGLHVSILNHRPLQSNELSLILSSHGLMSNHSRLFNLFEEALTRTNWTDHDRLKTVLKGSASSLVNSIANSGHSLAISMAASPLNPYRRRHELLSGLSQTRFLNQLAANEGIGDVEQLSIRLKTLAEKILTHGITNGTLAVIGDDEKATDCLRAGGQLMMKSLGRKSLATSLGFPNTGISHGASSSFHRGKAIIVPFATNFVGVALQTDPNNVNSAANLAILSRLLSTKILHGEIREKGGAYGGKSTYSPLDGLFSLFSYRDPSPIRTIDFIQRVGELMRNEPISEQDLLEAKLAIFSDIDSPADLADEGLYNFKYEVTDEERQQYRDALFSVTSESVRETSQTYLHSQHMSSVALIQNDPKLIDEFGSRFGIIDVLENLKQ